MVYYVMDIALAGVSKKWQDLMDLEALELILAAGDIVPPAPLVFEALRYGNPSDINTVIICQGAIPNPSESLFGSLAWGGEATAPSGDPRPWAVQGVLKFNDSLMVRRGAGHHDVAEWRPFIEDLLRRFCIERAEAGARIHFLLWGPGARVYAPLARHHNHAAREWADPLVENGACPHFEEVNAALAASGRPPIVWDSLAPVIAFSDGACSRNGKPGARAAFAALITGAQFGATVIRGEVSPTEYAFIDERDPERGICTLQRAAIPSNNRGELLGIIYAFLALLRGRALGAVEVVSDSKISINTLEVWLPARLKNKTSQGLKNYDLVMIAWRLLGMLRLQAATVTLTHTRSHQKPPLSTAPSRERLIWKGNDAVDQHAGVPLTTPVAAHTIEVLSALAILQGFAHPSYSPER